MYRIEKIQSLLHNFTGLPHVLTYIVTASICSRFGHSDINNNTIWTKKKVKSQIGKKRIPFYKY